MIMSTRILHVCPSSWVIVSIIGLPFLVAQPVNATPLFDAGRSDRVPEAYTPYPTGSHNNRLSLIHI